MPPPERVTPGTLGSGSYAPEDVTFLLRPLALETVPVAQKERLIQSGARHYSEMLSFERAPDARYLGLFHAALERNGARLARDLLSLSELLEQARGGEITLLSLARGGTPMGVLLRRELERRGRGVSHFSLSIVRDRGLDFAALSWLLERGYAASSWAFVDGWSAKGVIGRELASSVTRFNAMHGTSEHGAGARPELFVVSDLSGEAAHAATQEDYLIPSSLLNATVSGLISRTVLERSAPPEQLHGAALLEHLREHDLSRFFVDAVWAEMQRSAVSRQRSAVSEQRLTTDRSSTPFLPTPVLAQQRHLTGRAAHSPLPTPHSPLPTPQQFLHALALEQGVPYAHLKPGIGEATRALLRRVPERVLLRDSGNPETAHLVHLAREKGVVLEAAPGLPYLALAVIARMDAAEG